MSIQHQFHSLFYHKKLERKYMYSRVKRNQMNKVNKYSIRKSSFGAVSVAVAALMVFGTYSNVSADEQKVDSHRTEKEEQKVSEKPEETKQEKSEEKIAELPLTLQAPVLEKEELDVNALLKKEAESKVAAETKNSDSKELISKDVKLSEEKNTSPASSEKVKEEKSVEKTTLEQVVSEAEVLNQVAVRYAQETDRKVEEKALVQEAVKAATIQISQSKSLLKDSYVSAENLKTQLNQLYSAIETVYTELQRAGHGKKISASLSPTQTQDVAIDNGNIIASGTIDMADRVTSTGIADYRFQLKFKNGAYHKGDIFTIGLKELPQDNNLPQKLVAEGKVFAERVSLVQKNDNAKAGSLSYWASRGDRDVALDTKESWDLVDKGSHIEATYRFTDEIERLDDVTFELQYRGGIRYPRVNVDKSVTGVISVNGQNVVTKNYTVIKTDVGAPKVYDTPATANFTGDVMLDDDGSIKTYNSTLRIGTWKSNFSAGTRFTVRINDTEFNKFATVGEFIERGAHNVEMINTSPDTSRTRVNRHNVILEAPREEPGQHAKFKILKAADNELTFELVSGKMLAGRTYVLRTKDFGVDRVPTSHTVNYLNEARNGFKSNVPGTLTVVDAKGKNLTDQYEQAADSDWKIANPDMVRTDGRLVYGDVAVRFVDTQGKMLLPAIAAVENGGILQDKFTTVRPSTKIDTSYVATLERNTTETEVQENKGIQTTSITAPYLLHSPNGKYYVFKEYAQNDRFYSNTKTSGTITRAQANVVAVYEEAKFGKVDIQYRDKTSQAILETFNTPHDKSSNLINLLGNNYDVTAKVPERFEKDGVVYVLSQTPANSKGHLTQADIHVVYDYVAQQKAYVKYLNQTETSPKVLGNVDSVVGLPGETIAYNSKNRINQYLKQGYELVHDGFANANDKRFDSEKQTDQVFSVQLIEKVVTVTADDPKPIAGNPLVVGDALTPVWPKSVENLDTLRKMTKQTIHYKYQKDGKQAFKDVVRSVVFERVARVNLVTGAVIYDNWKITRIDDKPVAAVDTTVHKPNVTPQGVTTIAATPSSLGNGISIKPVLNVPNPVVASSPIVTKPVVPVKPVTPVKPAVSTPAKPAPVVQPKPVAPLTPVKPVVSTPATPAPVATPQPVAPVKPVAPAPVTPVKPAVSTPATPTPVVQPKPVATTDSKPSLTPAEALAAIKPTDFSSQTSVNKKTETKPVPGGTATTTTTTTTTVTSNAATAGPTTPIVTITTNETETHSEVTSVIHTGTTSHTHVVGVVTKPHVVVTHPKPSVQPKPHLTRPHHGPVHHVPSRPGKQVKPIRTGPGTRGHARRHR